MPDYGRLLSSACWRRANPRSTVCCTTSSGLPGNLLHSVVACRPTQTASQTVPAKFVAFFLKDAGKAAVIPGE